MHWFFGLWFLKGISDFWENYSFGVVFLLSIILTIFGLCMDGLLI